MILHRYPVQLDFSRRVGGVAFQSVDSDSLTVTVLTANEQQSSDQILLRHQGAILGKDVKLCSLNLEPHPRVRSRQLVDGCCTNEKCQTD